MTCKHGCYILTLVDPNSVVLETWHLSEKNDCPEAADITKPLAAADLVADVCQEYKSDLERNR